MSWEQVVKADRQCIIINNYSTPTAAQKEQFLQTSPITKNLTAVKNRCLLPLTYDEVTPAPATAKPSSPSPTGSTPPPSASPPTAPEREAKSRRPAGVRLTGSPSSAESAHRAGTVWSLPTGPATCMQSPTPSAPSGTTRSPSRACTAPKCRNSPDLQVWCVAYAARWYSLITPPRISRRCTVFGAMFACQSEPSPTGRCRLVPAAGQSWQRRACPGRSRNGAVPA